MEQLRLERIKAVAHPEGNRVDLRWLNPEPHLFPGVRVMRKQGTYPTSPTIDEERVADIKNTSLFTINLDFKNDLDNKILSPDLSARFLDHEDYEIILSGQAVVSPVVQGSRWHIIDGELIYLIVNSNGALDVYDMSRVEDTGLQAEVVYYYAFFPYKRESTSPTGRVYIDDSKNHVSAMATGRYDFAGQMHRMLPSIYHRYDTASHLRYFLDLPGSQLDQLYSFATAALNFFDINRVDGKLLPLLAQWIGWDTDYNLEIAAQRNELSNAPAMFQTTGTIPNLEAAVVKCTRWETRTKEFVHNVFLSNRPEQLNLWLCQQNEDGEWEESNDVFSLDFAYEGRPAAVRDDTGTLWLFYHTLRDNKWEIWAKTYQKGQGWSPSQPFTSSETIDKYPTAACQNQTLWVFWSSYHQADQAWKINYRKRIHGRWFEMDELETKDILPGPGNQRKNPCAVVGHKNRLWLFWLEKEQTQWQLKYTYHQENTGWKPGPPIDFPGDENAPPVVKDFFVLFHSHGNKHSLRLFLTRRKPVGAPGQRCWEIVFREKPISGNWGDIQHLPKEPDDASYHDVEPAAIAAANGQIQLFWSSNRSGSWSLWKVEIDKDSGALSEPQMLVNSPYSQRTPLPLLLNNEVSLLYRSNRCISYESEVYRSTRTIDYRYSGSTTVDIRNRAKIGLHGTYEDFQTYTYDTGKNGKPTNDNWYARETIGLYLTPDTENKQLIMKNRELIKGVLKRFLPIQTRLVFIINPPIYKELIYTYDFSDEEPRRLIGEMFYDSTLPEVYPGVNDDYYEDRVPEWIWIRSVEITHKMGQAYVRYKDHRTVDFVASPVDTNFRTWHKALKVEDKK